MKKKNSISDFTSERNAILLANFHRQLALQSKIDLERAFKEAAERPAPRFWVSETRAAIVLARMLRTFDNTVRASRNASLVTGGLITLPDPIEAADEVVADMYEEKRAMYRELFRRVLKLRTKMPDASLYDLAFEAVNSPAPRSYLSWQRAKIVIYNERKRKRISTPSR